MVTSNALPSRHEMQNEDDECDDEEEMNESARNMEGETTTPNEEQQDGND